MVARLNDRLKHWWRTALTPPRAPGCLCPETYPRVCNVQGINVVLHRYGCPVLPVER